MGTTTFEGGRPVQHTEERVIGGVPTLVQKDLLTGDVRYTALSIPCSPSPRKGYSREEELGHVPPSPPRHLEEYMRRNHGLAHIGEGIYAPMAPYEAHDEFKERLIVVLGTFSLGLVFGAMAMFYVLAFKGVIHAP